MSTLVVLLFAAAGILFAAGLSRHASRLLWVGLALVFLWPLVEGGGNVLLGSTDVWKFVSELVGLLLLIGLIMGYFRYRRRRRSLARFLEPPRTSRKRRLDYE